MKNVNSIALIPLFLLFASSFSYSQCIIAKYNLAGNAMDSLNSFNGTVIGANSTENCAGQSNEAYLFDGVNDYITLNNNTPVITGTEFTIHVVARIDGPGGGDDGTLPLFSQRDDVVPSQGGLSSIVFFARNINNNVAFIVRGSSSSAASDKITYPSPTDGLWHCYTAVCESDSIRLYFDGVEVAKAINTQSGNYSSSIDHVSIGNHAYSGVAVQGAFNGAIDEVVLYDCGIVPNVVCCSDDSLATNIEQVLTNNLSPIIYPNPSKGEINISDIPFTSIVKIYDVIGELIYINENIQELDVKIKLEQPAGVYFMELSRGEEKITRKLIINQF